MAPVGPGSKYQSLELLAPVGPGSKYQSLELVVTGSEILPYQFSKLVSYQFSDLVLVTTVYSPLLDHRIPFQWTI